MTDGGFRLAGLPYLAILGPAGWLLFTLPLLLVAFPTVTRIGPEMGEKARWRSRLVYGWA